MGAKGPRSAKKTKRVTIYAQDVAEVQVHLSRSLSAVFIRVSPPKSLQVSKDLGLKEKGSPYWNTNSDEESQKRLILLPKKLVDAEKNAIKQAFESCGIYKEISLAEANDILAKVVF